MNRPYRSAVIPAATLATAMAALKPRPSRTPFRSYGFRATRRVTRTAGAGITCLTLTSFPPGWSRRPHGLLEAAKN